MNTLHSRNWKIEPFFFFPKEAASSRFATEHKIETLVIFKYMIAW